MPSPSDTNLAQLRAFAAVAELRSYRRAATRLGVTPSAVSQAVRALESQLGVPLLQRTTRSVAPSEAGQRLLAELRPHLDGLAAALRAVGGADGAPAGTLRINLPRNAACLLLEPVVAPFLAAHPRIHLELVTHDGFVDIVAAGCDAGIRFAESVPRDMVALTLGGPQRFIVAGSPALLQRLPRPAEPWDLLTQPCVRLRFPSGALYHWEFRQGGASPLALDVPGPLTVDDQRMALRAALDGVGWAYLYEAAAAPHVAAGELVAVLDGWLPPGTPFQLYYPGRRQAAPPLRAFIDWWKASQPAA
ncbi:LysR substrate-binding domain-containing protein [Xylophilus sp.]|uniref:LysR substrate-binding domain-containing protein n=1 Tax=Xylophilus sp. TaxID=2653893 RepID=UPI0013B66175|nr:LysR substrate-binding domain-containing protein [Xylophilus sp.]KAF1042500.1 MAG: HTH-type transcriptional regulator PgrR [Xylophilus sp.]